MSEKYTYEYVKEYIENNDYELLSKEYVNAHSKLLLKCSKNHKFEMRYNSFQQGHGCPVCFGTPKHTYSYVKEYIENNDYELLSKEYIGNKTKLLLKCSKNHKFEMMFNCFQQGQRCPKCSNHEKLAYEYVKHYIEKESCKLLSKEYINNKTKLKLQCSKNHKFEMRFKDFKYGCQRCPKCFEQNQISRSEKEILSYIKSFYNGIILENDRKTILNKNTNRYLELDIFLPYINKAIEFNGEYWHSKINKIKNDKIKNNVCKEKNIDLMTIWYNDWMKNKEKVKDSINKWIKN